MKQSILLVYNVIGDGPDTRFYLIPIDDLTDFEKETLEKCQDKFINIDDETKDLMSLISRLECCIDEENEKKSALLSYREADESIPQDIQDNIGKWHKYLVDLNKTIDSISLNKIYNIGFAL